MVNNPTSVVITTSKSKLTNAYATEFKISTTTAVVEASTTTQGTSLFFLTLICKTLQLK